MLSIEVFYRNRHWRWAVNELGRLGQVIDRLANGRSNSRKAATRRAAEALTTERNKRNASL